MDSVYSANGGSASSRPSSCTMPVRAMLSSVSHDANTRIVDRGPRYGPLTPLYTWGTWSSDEELPILPGTLNLTDPCGEAGTNDLMMGVGFDRSEVNDFSTNGIETDLTAHDEYRSRLRRNYALASGNAPVNADLGGRTDEANRFKLYKSTVCVFCKNNGENLSVYGTHTLKDQLGMVSCPILQRYTCPVCGASGPTAHTLRYCPYNTSYRPSRARNSRSQYSLRKARNYWLGKSKFLQKDLRLNNT